MTVFEQLFAQNKDFIFKYLLKVSGNPSLAEELTQETFFRAYMNLAGLRDRAKAPSWLCAIAQNTYFAWYNEQKRLSPLTETALPSTDGVEETVERRVLAQRALTQVYTLKDPYKDVFLLAVFGGLSLGDISRLYGKSESWARVTFYRAKQQIIEKLTD